ncbi:solute carrier family 22 member 23-like isoform X1 [Myxocyprinus asiaticus]|uniref:solute carrier family 22 member 23-like isoform X1 n=2 Tax=Myxocyprinus asiaticus TaxID=70543 RepID=UPI002221A17F|nr:solute carrier family 22 member 23-like isoform X1 [Myxocyprinus asiaticus]XP_051555484.1 solute carrier family 22 member 23-like isoform X1 [Myxocyprinus asiaticus]
MCETVMAVSQLDTEPHPPENGFVTPETNKSPDLLSHTDGSVLPSLGGFGKFQKQLIVLTWIPALFIGFSQFSDNFLLAQPNSCAPVNANNSEPSALIAHALVNNGSHGTDRSSQCICMQSGFELQNNLEQNVITKWNLVCDSAWIVHIAKFSLLVGSIFGYLVLGVLADWFGRHPVLIVSVFFMLVFGMTVAFSVNVPMFSTLRFFEGFCLAGITLSLYALRIELCLPGWRFSMTMVANFVALAGQLLLPGLAALCRDWQILQVVIICPLFLMLSYIWIFPESLRWLLATQQYSRSKWIIEHIAKKNNVNLEQDAEELVTELNRALPKQSKKTCIVKMVGTRNLWKNIVVLCVNSLTGYGIHHCFARSMMDQDMETTTMFHNFYADYYTMAGIAVASCVALCPAVGVMGRRGGLLMFMIITALASLLQLGLLNLLGKYSVQLNIESSDTLKSNFSVAFSIIGMFSSHAVSNLSIFFCAEITPTVIRGGGLGLVLASAGFGMLTAPIMELHNQKGYFLHHVIFACCTLICIICILLLPETRNQSLPETFADGESYTRQPLLPPRKPGEQRLLLTKSESREYARVGDTPLHEAAVTAISTMDSTASSAYDLPMLLSTPVQQATGPVQLLGMKTLSSTKEQDQIKQTMDEFPTFVTTLESSAPSIEDPLLASIPNTSTPITINSLRASKIDSPPDVILDVLPSPTVDTPALINNLLLESPTSLIDHSLASTNDLQTPTILDVVIPPIVESPTPVASDSNFQAEMDSTGPLLDSSLPPLVNESSIHLTVASPDTPVDDSIPLCSINVSDPLPPMTGQSPIYPLNEIPPPSSIDSPVHLVNEILPPSPTEMPLLQILDSESSAPSSQVHAIPPQPMSSPLDSGTPLLHLVAPSVMDFIESGPPSPAVLESSATSSNGAALQITVDLTAPHATSTDSVTEHGHPVMADLTVSSPIDLGIPPAMDFTITETSTASGVLPS